MIKNNSIFLLIFPFSLGAMDWNNLNETAIDITQSRLIKKYNPPTWKEWKENFNGIISFDEFVEQKERAKMAQPAKHTTQRTYLRYSQQSITQYRIKK